MDNNFAANVIVAKLIEAQKRGVHVILLVDGFQDGIDRSLKGKLRQAGATVHTLNPFYKLWKLFIRRRLFHRHHEKLVVSDEKVLIGSSNLAEEYGGAKHGTSDYWDLNMFTTHTGLKQIREYFSYSLHLDDSVSLHPQKSDQEVLAELDEKFPDSPLVHQDTTLLRSNHPYREEVQENIIKLIDSAEKKVTLIQPYWVPIKKVETALLKARERNVEVELITAAKREQPCYSNLKNGIMMYKLISSGVKVFECPDRFLHMKTYVADDTRFTLGSFNNDKWSWNISNEVNILIESEPETKKLLQMIDSVKGHCRPVTMLRMEEFGNWFYIKTKFWEHFMSVFEWLSNQKRYVKAEKRFMEMEGRLKQYKEFRQDYTKRYTIQGLHNDWEEAIGRDF
jgi:cardiolipin synthase